MKRSLISLLALVMTLGFTLTAEDAEAKRLGGGRSSGITRDSSIMKRQAIPPKPAAPVQNAAPAPATPQPPASGMSRWLGPLAGLAAGIGIAALLSHFGMGAGLSSLVMALLIGVAVFFVIRLLFRRNAPQTGPMQYAGAGGNPVNMPTPPGAAGPAIALPGGAAPAATAAVPEGFDVEGFLRQAKLNFVRLQAANDAGNMDDVRQFTTPEMYAEVQMEYQERGKAAQQTDVVQLNAELLDVSSEVSSEVSNGTARQIASVRFFGSIRESVNTAPEAFDEVWHLTRPADASSGWVIAGIQQNN
ncbi:MAG: Tim44 domain-containing protein [Betaproteobacteria bacterium]|nr:Tim44 domain-containing protein [Betaproteobacteria bacterium]